MLAARENYGIPLRLSRRFAVDLNRQDGAVQNRDRSSLAAVTQLDASRPAKPGGPQLAIEAHEPGKLRCRLAGSLDAVRSGGQPDVGVVAVRPGQTIHF